jgi:two-component system, cell cycle response regulator
MQPVQALISGRIRLPSPPLIAVKILEEVRKDDFTFQDLAYLIESDPALTARILKASNSSYFNPRSKVTSIEKALGLLGSATVTNIALSFVIVSELQAESSGAFDTTIFWKRALTAAVAAEMISTLVGSPYRDIFVISLLQDIGILVMHGSKPHDYQKVFQYREQHQTPLCEAEQEIFGFDHQELGAELLMNWQLPEEIFAPIRHHHSGAKVSSHFQQQRDILCVADCLASFHCGTPDHDKINQAKHILYDTFGLLGKEVETLIETVAARSIEILDSFEIPPNAMRPLSLILQEANQELSDLYDSYDLQAIELKQAKEKADKRVQELHEANTLHRELAFRDGLTGVYNRRFFQEALDNELMRAQRYKRQFSLVILDVDNYKKINDAHGHTIGDLVLINVSKSVQEMVRATDIFARYGGDEFVIIMPETDLSNAIAIAENLRSRVEMLITTVGNASIKTTISLGLTSYGAIIGKKTSEQIIDMADKALYIAKHSGKNSIRALKFSEK